MDRFMYLKVPFCLLIFALMSESAPVALAQTPETPVPNEVQAESPDDDSVRTSIYFMKYASSNEIIAVLQDMSISLHSDDEAGSLLSSRIAVDPRTNSIIVAGTLEQHEYIRSLLDALDRPVEESLASANGAELQNLRIEIFWLGSAPEDFGLAPLTDTQSELIDLPKLLPQLERFEMTNLSLLSRLSTQTVVGPSREGRITVEGIGGGSTTLRMSATGQFKSVGPGRYEVELDTEILGPKGQSSLMLNFLTRDGKTTCIAVADTGPVRSLLLVRVFRDDVDSE